MEHSKKVFETVKLNVKTDIDDTSPFTQKIKRRMTPQMTQQIKASPLITHSVYTEIVPKLNIVEQIKQVGSQMKMKRSNSAM